MEPLTISSNLPSTPIIAINRCTEAAASAGVSEDTYRKGRFVLEQASEETLSAIRAGKLTINKAYNMIAVSNSTSGVQGNAGVTQFTST